MGSEALSERPYSIDTIRIAMRILEERLAELKTGICDVRGKRVTVKITSPSQGEKASTVTIIIQTPSGESSFMYDQIIVESRAAHIDVRLSNHYKETDDIICRHVKEGDSTEEIVDPRLLSADEAESILEIVTACLEWQKSQYAVREAEVHEQKVAIGKRVRAVLRLDSPISK